MNNEALKIVRDNIKMGYVLTFADAMLIQQAIDFAMQAEPVTAATVPPHIYRELVNQLRDTAVKYQGCQQLREQLSATLRTVITPAAPEQEV